MYDSLSAQSSYDLERHKLRAQAGLAELQHMSVVDSISVFRGCRYHHSVADTPDKMDPEELARCAAVLAVMAYTVADMEQPLFVPR
jgi:hypothetical protein